MTRGIKNINHLPAILIIVLLTTSCEVQQEWYAEPPHFEYGSILTGSQSLSDECLYSLEGIYKVTKGSDQFGDTLVLKRTGASVSLFGSKNIAYFVLGCGSVEKKILFEGYWRFAAGDQSGLARFYLPGAAKLIEGDTVFSPVNIYGDFGDSGFGNVKEIKLQLISRFSGRLRNDKFIIGAHRSGGRTADRLPASENSVEMIGYTHHFGSNAIELDVRLTSDGMPVLYHDPDLNIRLVRKGPVMGNIRDYTWPQIQSMVTLIHGEKIPSLEQALEAALKNSAIKTVWLDMKDPAALDAAITLQEHFLDKANTSGRDISILIGIPSEKVLEEFSKYPSKTSIPSLCELSPTSASLLQSKAWAFRWTEGIDEEKIIRMHGEGRKCLAWTLDVPEFTSIFISYGKDDQKRRLDGILTNYPSLAAYYHYVRHNF